MIIIGFGVIMFVAEIIEAQTAVLEPYPWFENLIPVSLGLSVIGLAIAWKNEGVGGAIAVGFVVVNLLLFVATGRDRVGMVALILTPVVLPGLMFLTCWWGTRELKTS